MNIFKPHVTSYTHIYWQQLRYSKCGWSTHTIPLKPENECVHAAIWTSEKSEHKIVHKTVQQVDEHFNTQCFGAVQTEPKCEQTTQNCFQTAADELFEVHSSTIKSQYPARPSKTTPPNRLTAKTFHRKNSSIRNEGQAHFAADLEKKIKPDIGVRTVNLFYKSIFSNTLHYWISHAPYFRMKKWKKFKFNLLK
jgi:hypothetical protein